MEWLTTSAITLGGSSVSWLEVLGAITGLASVWWAARERVWTWPVGIVNSALFLLLFLDAKLYATALLQVAFIALGVYGWREWVGGGPQHDELPVRRTRRGEWVGIVIAGVVAQAAWTTWLVASTDSTVAFWDSAVLVLSLVATFGQARKLVESWWIWIAVDTISIPLFLGQGLVVTALLYAVFGALCLVGLRDWTRSMQARAAAIVASADPMVGLLGSGGVNGTDVALDPLRATEALAATDAFGTIEAAEGLGPSWTGSTPLGRTEPAEPMDRIDPGGPP